MYITVGNSDSIVANINSINVDYYCSYTEPGTILSVSYGTTPGAGTVSLIPNPAGGYPNQVQAISIYNHSGGSVKVIVEYIDNLSNTRKLLDIALASGSTLTYTADGSGFQVYDVGGARQ